MDDDPTQQQPQSQPGAGQPAPRLQAPRRLRAKQQTRGIRPPTTPDDEADRTRSPEP